MAVEGYIIFNRANTADLYFGNRSIDSVYCGNTLVWRKIQNILKFDSSEQYVCIEYVPTVDVNLNDISVFQTSSSVHGWTFILNECGLCVARKTENGSTRTVIYTLDGFLKTASSFGSPKLLANRKYYICYKTQQWNSTSNFAYYQGQVGNYKLYKVEGGVDVYTGYDLQSVPCVGSASSVNELRNVPANTLFTWRGPALGNSFVPNENGAESPYPFYSQKDLSHLQYIFTDSDFNSLSDDEERYAFVYYKMGNVEGNEVAFNTSYWDRGFSINGTTVFGTNAKKFYKAKGIMTQNHITSMTPITTEPSNPAQFDLYYKGTTSSGWLDINGNPITNRGVVIRNYSQGHGYWEHATAWTYEFEADSTYNGTNYLVQIYDNEAVKFNKATLHTDKKYYLRVNNTEV